MLKDKYLQEIKIIVASELEGKNYELLLFGSRAKNTEQNFSDIDLSIRSKEKIDRLHLSNLREKFEDSNIPYCIDLVDFIDADAALQASILKEGILLG